MRRLTSRIFTQRLGARHEYAHLRSHSEQSWRTKIATTMTDVTQTGCQVPALLSMLYPGGLFRIDRKPSRRSPGISQSERHVPLERCPPHQSASSPRDKPISCPQYFGMTEFSSSATRRPRANNEIWRGPQIAPNPHSTEPTNVPIIRERSIPAVWFEMKP